MSKSETQSNKLKGANIMKEIGIINVNNNERNVIFGRNPADAFRKAKLNPNEWIIDWVEYID
jgi:hypothetical protein